MKQTRGGDSQSPSASERLVNAITGWRRVVIAVLLVLSMVLGAGIGALEEDSSLDQFETDPPEADAYEDAQERFGVEENETSAQIVVRDDDVLTRESFLETLALQRDLRENETVNESLAEEDQFMDLSEIVATVSVQENQADDLEDRADELEEDEEALEERSEEAVELLDETIELQGEYEETQLAFELGQIDEETYNVERDRLETAFEEIEDEAQETLTDEEHATFVSLIEDAREIQGELVRLGIRSEIDGLDDAAFERRMAERSEEMEGIYDAVEADVFAESIAELEAERERLEVRSARAIDLLDETRELQEEYEENELAFERDQIDEATYQAERDRLEGEFELIEAEAAEILTDEEFAVFAPLLAETREIQGELVRVGAQFEFDQISEAAFQQQTAALSEELEDVYAAVEGDVFADSIADLEQRSEELEVRSERAVDLLNETRELQEEYEENELAFEFDQIGESTYEAERDRLESEFELIEAEATEILTDEEFAAFAPLLEETRDVQGELIRIGVRGQFDPITDEAFEDRSEALADELEAVYEGVEEYVLVDSIDEVEERADDLEEEFDAIRELELTLDEQVDELEAMTQSDVDDVLETILDEDAHRETFLFVPGDFEAGSTTADARMVFVSQTTEDPGAVAVDEDDEIVDAQLALADIVDDQLGDDALVFGVGVLTDEIDRSLYDSLWLVLPLALLFVTVVLTIAYRDLLDILLGLFGVIIVLAWTFGFMGWVGFDVTLVMVAVPVLLVGISIDYSIHVFMRYREQRKRAESAAERVPSRAMSIILLGLGVAFVWVTTTAAIGFLSNLVSPVEPIEEFGIASAFGMVSALTVFGVFVPAVKVELDEMLERKGFDRQLPAFGTGGGRISGVLALGQRASERGPWLVVVVVLLLTAGGVAGAVQLDTTFEEEDFIAEDPPDWTQELPEPFAVGEYETSESLSYVDERFLRLDERTHVVVEGNVTRDDTLERVDETETLAAQLETTIILPSDEPHVTSPVSEMEAVAEENETFNETYTDADTTGDGVPDTDLEDVYDEFVDADEERAAGVLDWTDDGEYEGAQLLVSVRGDADRTDITADGRTLAGAMEGDDLETTATGQPIVFNIVEDDLFDAVLESLLVSMGAVFLVLMVVYRWRYESALLGAITLAPIILTVTWILGTMYLLSIPFNVMTGTITSLTIGLGVAYNIHMTERFLIERGREPSLQDALYRSVTGTGGALFGSAGTTVVGFGVLILSILPPLQQFGLITALTIAYAFIGSVFVLPSFLVLWTRHLEGPDRSQSPAIETAPDEGVD